MFNQRQAYSSTVDPFSWRALFAFAAYRLFLALVLFFVFYFKLPPDFLGSTDPELYRYATLLYLFVALVLIVTTSQQLGQFNAQTRLQLVIDIVMLGLIMHASGGIKTGLGSLLVVVVVAGGTLIPGRLAAFIAAIATLAILFEASYSQIAGDGVTKYSQAGMLGATFFATALLAQFLSHKLLRSQVLAEQHAQNVAKLADLNQHIISRMQVGVLVLDPNGRVTMCNESARQMLGIKQVELNFLLKQYVPQLSVQLWLWQQRNPQPFEPFQARADLPEVLAKAAKLDNGETLVYIENTSALAQQAQQLKLASLGRLTASIAHEVRNPLGAISHAGELLAEIGQQHDNIAKLTDIIQRHSKRVNTIIDTVLQMSRRKSVKQKVIVLATWLEKFISEFCESKQIKTDVIGLQVSSPLAKVWMDPEQLHQVMLNLLENAWHYCDAAKSSQPVTIKLNTQTNEVIIDVIDNGVGVSENSQAHLFEPFHSERTGGTGLGLYLARELCQANGARLSYLDHDVYDASCFRISFPLEWRDTIQ